MKTLTVRLDDDYSIKLDNIKDSIRGINTDSGIIKLMITEFLQLQQDNKELRSLVSDTEEELWNEKEKRTVFINSLREFIEV